jgi:hypothetical protein
VSDAVHAGAVRARLDGPDLRALRLGGRELAQRIYVAVRDEHWGTVPGEVSGLQLEQGADSFRIRFVCRHRQGPVDFEWQATYTGAADGTIACTMDGVAHGTFRYAKIGFNVHHPLLESVGRAWRAVGPGGPMGGRLEREIEPQRVIDGTLTAMFSPYSELSIGDDSDDAVSFSFEGDLFELQDHRNWSDGNFKSYGTPLSVPWPMDAEPGLRIRQTVTVHPPARAGESGTGGPVRIALGAATARRLPAVGLAAAGAIDEHTAGLLARVRPAHLRVAVRLHETGWPAMLADGLADCARLGADCELALSLEPGDDRQLAALADALADPPAPVARVLVLERQDAFSAAGPVTTPASVARARAALAPVLGNVAFAGGSDQFFSDVNRNPPAVDALDAVCFGLCPQVHAADDASLMENLPALPDAVATARAICPGLAVVVSPVTLAARLGPFPAGEPGPGDPPANADSRLHTAFGASWTLGALAWLAREEPQSLTFYETAGPRGIVDDAGGATPALRVLDEVAARRDDALLDVAVSDPLAVSALAFDGPAGTRLLVANHTGELRPIELAGLPGVPAAVRDLVDGSERPWRGNVLELPPYAVVRLDVPRPSASVRTMAGNRFQPLAAEPFHGR